MKKTLIALMALAGVAAAETGKDLNTKLEQALNEANYTLGDAFTITTTLAGIGNLNTGIVAVADNYYIVNQSHAYWGLNNTDSNNLTNNRAWTLSVSEDGTDYTYTSTDGTLPIVWAQNQAGSDPAQRTVGAWIGVEISSDGTDSTVKLSYAGSSIVDTFILKGTALDASEISFKENIGDVQSATITVVPEPTTATLSLLALAGLAARRRRK